MKNYLSPLLSKADSMPFLFLGSGFSRRYLNTPTWEDLLKYVAGLIYDDEFIFVQKRREAEKRYNKSTHYNRYMTYLCDLISDDLDKVWYTDEKFKSHREKHRDIVVNQGTPPIKIEIAEYLLSFQETLPDMSKEIEALKLISPSSIGGIITTNYDDLQERIFDYEVYASQDELLFHTKYDLGEIYKIHGSASDPNTVLINTADYEIIEQKHKYIAAKLLTIFVEHPIFFIGYSISDEDIRSILNDIQLSLNEDQLKEIENRLFHITWDDNVTTFEASTISISFDNGRTIIIKEIKLSDYTILYETLGENRAKYPVKFMRYIKEDMYNLVLSDNPQSRMMVNLPKNADLTKIDQDSVEWVVGFGVIELANRGYQTPTANDIYRDIVFDDGNYISDSLLIKTIPELKKMYGKLPVYKYLAKANDSLQATFEVSNYSETDFSDFKTNSINRRGKVYSSVLSIANSSLSVTKKLSHLETLNADEITIQDLRKFLHDTLSSHPEILDSQNRTFGPTERAAIRRLIRELDFLEYKKCKKRSVPWIKAPISGYKSREHARTINDRKSFPEYIIYKLIQLIKQKEKNHILKKNTSPADKLVDVLR